MQPPGRSQRSIDRVESALSLTGALALLLMVAVSFADVVLRVAGRPITGAYELTGLLVGLLVFATLPRISARDEHVRAGVLATLTVDRPRVLRALRWTRRLATAAMMSLLAWTLARYCLQLSGAGDRAPFIEIPLAWVAGFGACSFTAAAACALGARAPVPQPDVDPDAPVR